MSATSCQWLVANASARRVRSMLFGMLNNIYWTRQLEGRALQRNNGMNISQSVRRFMKKREKNMFIKKIWIIGSRWSMHGLFVEDTANTSISEDLKQMKTYTVDFKMPVTGGNFMWDWNRADQQLHLTHLESWHLCLGDYCWVQGMHQCMIMNCNLLCMAFRASSTSLRVSCHTVPHRIHVLISCWGWSDSDKDTFDVALPGLPATASQEPVLSVSFSTGNRLQKASLAIEDCLAEDHWDGPPSDQNTEQDGLCHGMLLYFCCWHSNPREWIRREYNPCGPLNTDWQVTRNSSLEHVTAIIWRTWQVTSSSWIRPCRRSIVLVQHAALGPWSV
jgi:hypothetical protein